MKDSVEPDVELTPAATSTPAAESTSTAQPLQPDLTMEPQPGRKLAINFQFGFLVFN